MASESMTETVIVMLLQHLILRYWATTGCINSTSKYSESFSPPTPKDAKTVLRTQADGPTTKIEGGGCYQFGLAKDCCPI